MRPDISICPYKYIERQKGLEEGAWHWTLWKGAWDKGIVQGDVRSICNLTLRKLPVLVGQNHKKYGKHCPACITRIHQQVAYKSRGWETSTWASLEVNPVIPKPSLSLRRRLRLRLKLPAWILIPWWPHMKAESYGMLCVLLSCSQKQKGRLKSEGKAPFIELTVRQALLGGHLSGSYENWIRWLGVHHYAGKTPFTGKRRLLPKDLPPATPAPESFIWVPLFESLW